MMRFLGKIIDLNYYKHETWSRTEVYISGIFGLQLRFFWCVDNQEFSQKLSQSIKRHGRHRVIDLGPVDFPRDQGLKLKMCSDLEFNLSIVVMYPEFFCPSKVHALLYILFEAIDGSSLWLYVNIILPSCQSLTHPSKHPAEPSGVAYCELSSGTGAWSARLDSLTWHAVTEDDQRALKLYLIYTIYKRLNFKQC